MSQRVREAVVLAMAVAAGAFGGQALARWVSVHNQTFDLAFYVRMAWGLGRGDLWVPIAGAKVWGLHLSAVLLPFGWLSRAFHGLLAPSLLVAQAVAVAATAWPLAKMGERRAGAAGAIAASFAWLLYPNLGHVATYEFHPGTLAVLPMAWALNALDDRRVRMFALSCGAIVLCREDLALVTCLFGVIAWRIELMRVTGLAISILSLAYFSLFAFVLHPRFAPPHGSMELHFGNWGSSAADVLTYLAHHPTALLDHLKSHGRWLYPFRVMLPLGLLPLLGARWLLFALPILAINLASHFPTATRLDSHYLTPAVPIFIAAAAEGAYRLGGLLRPLYPYVALGACALVGHIGFGGSIASADRAHADYRFDAQTAAARRVFRHVPKNASLQAPDALLPHLAERLRIYRSTPPWRATDYVVLDAAHRVRFAHQETLLRTTEEPLFRSWLIRPDYGLSYASGNYLVFKRGLSAREGWARRYFGVPQHPSTLSPAPAALTSCLGVERVRMFGTTLTLTLRANGPCTDDLALRIGTPKRALRTDLLFDGLLSPAILKEGDVVRSTHALGELEARRLAREGLVVATIRANGAPVDARDPQQVSLSLNGS